MRFFLALTLLVLNLTVNAHEVRPAYLGITQLDDSTYSVVWKIPAMGEMSPKLYPYFPEEWIQSDKQFIPTTGALKQEWQFISYQPVNGGKIVIDGLSRTIMDVLITIELKNDVRYSEILRADSPIYEIPTVASGWSTIITYLILGIDHILLGIDHLLFVLALVLVTRGKWKIIKTVTAFTIAHSITLTLAALGMVNVPIPPVEAIIALSIVFLAKEIAVHQDGHESLTYRYPWIVAFSFGLLHGFGFASALSDTGLPQGNIPLALAFFNIGVEIGQVAFVLVILVIEAGIRRLRWSIPKVIKKVPVYAIGGIASYWLIDRVIGFWG